MVGGRMLLQCGVQTEVLADEPALRTDARADGQTGEAGWGGARKGRVGRAGLESDGSLVNSTRRLREVLNIWDESTGTSTAHVPCGLVLARSL